MSSFAIRTVLAASLLSSGLLLLTAPALSHTCPFPYPEDRAYNLPDPEVKETRVSTLIGSATLSTEVQTLDHATSSYRVYGTPNTATRNIDQLIDVYFTTKHEGRLLCIYRNNQVDVQEITTITTPYDLYERHSWKERTQSIVDNTYSVTPTYDWLDPKYSVPLTLTKPPFSEVATGEIVNSPWIATESVRLLGSGVEASSSQRVISSRVDTTLQKCQPYVAGLEKSIIAKSKKDLTFSQDTARSTQRGQGKTPSGVASRKTANTEAAKSTANLTSSGPNFTALLEVAATQPDLYDDQGRLAWKLSASDNALIFTPYIAAGLLSTPPVIVPISRGHRTKGDSDAGKIHIHAYLIEGGSVTLYGEFKAKLLEVDDGDHGRHDNKPSKSLTSRRPS
ncbi:MAG: hypothetical protein HY692_10145 [Cyanobacteria bacterium NC_groundwater_1444_Ag_S-0.65um_54_12]|nr:hypothetical protein [Cyanobacteria bacterium NC_groundwater_1444_Ag_S-0.65um_54_12]